MAKTTSTHLVSIDADFSEIARKSLKASKTLGDNLGKSVEAGFRSGNLAGYKQATRMMKEQEVADRKAAQAVYALEVKLLGNYAEKQEDLIKEIAALEAKVKEEGISDAMKKQRQAAVEVFQEQKEMIEKLHKLEGKAAEAIVETELKGWRELSDKHEKAGKELVRNADRVAQIEERSVEAAKMFSKINNEGALNFNNQLESAIGTLQSGIKNIDMGALFSGGAGMLGKGLGGLADMGAGMGGIVGPLAAVAGVLGTVVIALGAFAALMFSIDKEVKEFNKSAINTFGSRSVMNLGAGDLHDNLQLLRHATQDLTTNLGLTEQEAIGLFDALDAGGHSFSKIVKGATNARDATNALNMTLQETVAVSKAIGVSVTEYASTATEMANTYATSLEDISGQFATIGKMAADAGFSTRRFYSLVVQATASQAGLNNRIEDTAEVLARMSKILGDKQAAEFMAGIGGAFKEASSQDLMKTAIIAGAGTVRKIAGKALERQSASFLGGEGTPERATKAATLGEAARASGVSVETGTPEALLESLSAMTNDERDRFTSTLTAMDSSLGRRLDDLVAISEDAAGGVTDLPGAMRRFSVGDILETYVAEAKTFGLELGDMNAIQRAEFAAASGLSEAQINEMERLNRGAEGAWGNLERMRSMSDEEREASGMTNDRLDELYGAHIENGRIMSESGTELQDAMHWLTDTSAGGDLQNEEDMAEDLSLAYKAFDETVTIGDILENKITYYLRALYENVGEPLIRWIGSAMGFDEEKRAAAGTTRNMLYDEIQLKQASLTEASSTVTSLGARRDLSEEETATLEEARRTAESSRAFIEAAQDTMRELSSGNYAALEGTRTVTRRTADDMGGGFGDGEGAARAGMSLAGMDSEYQGTESYTMTPEEAVAAFTARTGAASAPAPGTSPVPSIFDFMAPTAAPAVAGTTTAPATAGAARPSTPTTGTGSVTERLEAMATAAEATLPAVVEASELAADHARELVTTIVDSIKESTKLIVKALTKDKKLGDMIAKSKLPDAIVDAQIKREVESLAFAAGLDPTEAAAAVEEYSTTGEFSDVLTSHLNALDPAAAAALAPQATRLGAGVTLDPETKLIKSLVTTGPRALVGAAAGSGSTEETESMDDFIYRGDGIRGSITPIDSADEFVGMKPGGPIDRAMGGGNVTINISGGDERRVFDVVKRVIQQAGLGAGRVTARA